MLGIVKELVKRGHEVIIYNTQDFAKKITEAGAEFRAPPVKFKEIDLRIMQSATTMAEISLYATELMVEPSVAIMKMEKPDCIIHDSLSLWGKLIGIRSGIPTIALVPSMGINIQVILTGIKHIIPDLIQLSKEPVKLLKIMRKYRSLYVKAGKNPPLIFDIFSNEEKLNIAFTSEYFQLCRNSFGSNYKFVGPIIYNRKETSIPGNLLRTEKPIVYIALGTVYNDNPDLYKRFISAFKNTKFQVFMSIGKYIKLSDLGEIPGNFYIKNYLPQLEILKKTALFISHAGMNSVNESLYFGVPMLLFPNIQEQRLNSARVEKLGAGIYVNKNIVSTDELINLANNICNNSSYKKNAQKIGKTLREAGGVEKAIEYILEFVE